MGLDYLYAQVDYISINESLLKTYFWYPKLIW